MKLRNRIIFSAVLCISSLCVAVFPTSAKANIFSDFQSFSTSFFSDFSSSTSRLTAGVWFAITDPLSDLLVPLFTTSPQTPLLTGEGQLAALVPASKRTSAKTPTLIPPVSNNSTTRSTSSGQVINNTYVSGVTQAMLASLESRLQSQINSIPRNYATDVRSAPVNLTTINNVTQITSTGGTFTSLSVESLGVTGTGTTTFAGGIQATALNITSTTASSTFANGLDLAAGCFAINGSCLSSYSNDSVNAYIHASTTIPKLYTANTFTGTNIFSGNVGIGTTSPYTKLGVVGDIVGTNIYATTSVYIGNKIVMNGDPSRVATNFIAQADGAMEVSGFNLQLYSAVGDLRFGRSQYGATFATLNENTFSITGNVGIGTTSSVAKLVIDGGTSLGSELIIQASTNQDAHFSGTDVMTDWRNSAGTSVLKVKNSSWSNPPYASLDFTSGPAQISAAAGASITTASNGPVSIGNSNNASNFGFVFGKNNTVSGAVEAMILGQGITNSIHQSLMIGPSDAAKMTILSTGNVGVGTVAPQRKFEVSGDTPYIRLTNTATNGKTLEFFAGTTGVGFGTPTTPSQFVLESTAPTNAVTVNANYMTLGLNYGLTSSGSILYIRGGGSGSVGHGTKIEAYNGSAWQTAFQTTHKAGGNIDAILVPSNGGNVGIGTTSPYTKLGVAGQITADNIWATSTTAINYFGNNVGVGTNNPTYKLTVKADDGGALITGVGDSNWSALVIENTSDTATQMFFRTEGGSIGANMFGVSRNNATEVFAQNNSALLIGNLGDIPVVFGNNNLERMRVAAGGNVGIGTASPVAKLQIASTDTTPQSYADRFTSLAFSRSDLSSSYLNKITNSWSGTPANNTMNFEVTNSAGTTNTILSLLGNGLIGIGTSSAKIISYGNDLRITENSAAAQFRLLPYGNDIYFDNSIVGDTYFRTNGNATAVTNMMIKSDGNVGIGTTTPTLGPLVMNSGAYVTTGGTWTNASSRNVKENFTVLDKADILAKINKLDLTQWNYKSEEDGVTHIGPIAEDFYAQFGLGGSNSSISTIDPAGVALVGIQALSERLTKLENQFASSSTPLNLRGVETQSGGDTASSTILIIDNSGVFDTLKTFVVSMKEVVAEKITASIGYFGFIKTDNIEVANGITMNSPNGTQYCVTIGNNGEFVKTPGACGATATSTTSIISNPVITPTPTPTSTPTPTTTPSPTPTETPTPTDTPIPTPTDTPTPTSTPSPTPTDTPTPTPVPVEPITPPVEPPPAPVEPPTEVVI